MDAEKLKELRELVAGAKTGPKELPENEALFVAAVNALPALLDEVEALTALLRRVRTHLAVGCVARAGYTTRHTELAIEINAARHEPKDAEMKDRIPVESQRDYRRIPDGYTTDADGSWVRGSVYEGDDRE